MYFIIDGTSFYQYLALHFLQILLWVWIWKTSESYIQNKGLKKSLVLFGIISVIIRCFASFSSPIFEDDYHRYVWDAKVWSDEINPFVYEPAHEELEYLRDENWIGVNYKEVPTIYPPVLQFFFKICYWISPGNAFVFQFFYLLFDICSMVFLFLLLKNLNLRMSNFLLFAYNPLLIKESYNSLHFESLLILLTSGFLFFFIKHRYVLSYLMLILGLLVKVYPIVLAVFLLKRMEWWKFLLLPVVVVVAYLPFWDEGDLLFQGLLIFGKQWEFNSGAFGLIQFVSQWFSSNGTALAKGLVVLGFIGVLMSCMFQVSKQKLPIEMACKIILLYAFLSSPTANPWYLLWVLPFVVLKPAWSDVVLTAQIALSYHFYIHSQDYFWVRTLEYLPYFVVLFWEYKVYLNARTLLDKPAK